MFKTRITGIILFAIFISFTGICQTGNIYQQLGKASIEDVIAAMTLEEKAALVVGTGLKMGNLPADAGGFQIPNQPIPGSLADKTRVYISGAVGRTLEVPRLGITTMEMVDGPAGASFGSRTTAYPIATNLSSTWDVDLVYKIGRCMGNEVLEYGLDLLLAPAMNIHRNPLTGRNFEYYSEDPWLSGKIGGAMVNGIQSQGVGTSVKHFVANNQETNRISVDAIISERALREIYLRGFEIALKESYPWTLMASYNSVNGATATENYDLLTTIVREDWNYQGIIMSDWETGKDPAEQMKAGLDLIMPGPYQDTVIIQAVKNGILKEEVLDQNIAWILKTVMKSPKFMGYKYSNKPDLEHNAQIARKAGAEGMVLLKNENALPIKDKKLKMALFGNGSYVTNVGGAGSGFVMRAGSTVNIIDGMTNAGYTIEEKVKQVYTDFIQENTPEQNRMRAIRGFIKRAAEMPVNLELAELTAQNADLAVITVRRDLGETADREIEDDFLLTETEANNIKTITSAFQAKGKKVVVVLNIGSVIETASWKKLPDAILVAWQPGQEAGNAVADIFSGIINPSGKLTATFPVKYEDIPSAKNFPGNPADNPKEVVYEEGIYVGYRYFNTFQVETSYPFGYGLSYTDFSYSDLELSSTQFEKEGIVATVTITNTGKVAGKEVVQLYISAPNMELDKPSEELKRFAKTDLLAPGKSQIISFKIDAKSLASFNAEKSSWIADAGNYSIKIGASCEDIKLIKSFKLPNKIQVEKVTKALVSKVAINELKNNRIK